MQQVESEWATLKNLVKRFADDKFEWRTNADGTESLQVDNVAATFRGGRRILFDRKPPRPGSIFPFDSPIASEEWQLELRVTASSVLWSIRFAPKLHGDFSSSDLAERIVRRLVQYNEDYTKACAPK